MSTDKHSVICPGEAQVIVEHAVPVPLQDVPADDPLMGSHSQKWFVLTVMPVKLESLVAAAVIPGISPALPESCAPY